MLHFSIFKYALKLLGCQNTPARGPRYYSQHRATAVTFRDDSDESNDRQMTDNSDQPGALITRILNEKTARQGVLSEVYLSIVYMYICSMLCAKSHYKIVLIIVPKLNYLDKNLQEISLKFYFLVNNLLLTLVQGCHGQGKLGEKRKLFKVREKAGSFLKSRGKSLILSKSVKSQGILFSFL